MGRITAILGEEEKKLRGLGSSVVRRPASGFPEPMDSEFASAISNVIYRTLMVVLESKSISPDPDLEKAFEQCTAAGLKPPAPPEGISDILYRVYREFNMKWKKAFDPLIEVDRAICFDYANGIVNWAKEIINDRH